MAEDAIAYQQPCITSLVAKVELVVLKVLLIIKMIVNCGQLGVEDTVIAVGVVSKRPISQNAIAMILDAEARRRGQGRSPRVKS